MSMGSERLSAALVDRYRIERELGTGGMATVYLAHDVRHDRKVAIKVLKPELAAVLGADRFVVEIKTTASLQHPHILPLFDSGTADGFLFYVMPYIQGETIREKLNRETQFGVDEAVRIAREVASALDYAHRHGVIHRDIKPENILLHDGSPMVMDFGIALAVSAAAGGRMTETGLSLGTPHYMSPEQATADREITGRSDVYSLASVLYEMLAGVPPHEGGSAQQVVMRIIADTPRLVSDLRKSVPPNVAGALANALEKVPADRFESAAKFAEALANQTYRYGRSTVSLTSSPTRRRLWLLPVAGAALVIAGVLAGMQMSRPMAIEPDVVRFPLALPRGQSLDVRGSLPFAVSPDGKRIAIVGMDSAGTRRLMLRSAAQLDAIVMQGTEDAANPFFSPDGAAIGFISATEGQIKRVNISDGRVSVISNEPVSLSFSPVWDATLGIVFVTRGWQLRHVPSGGGPSKPLARAPVRLDTGATSIVGLTIGNPAVLAGAKSVLVTICSRAQASAGSGFCREGVGVLDLDTGILRPILSDATRAWVVDGNLVLFSRQDGGLFATRFDSKQGRVIGDPVSMSITLGTRRYAAAISPAGTIAYLPVDSGDEQVVVEVDRAGRERTAIATPGPYSYLRLSPDGRRLLMMLPDAARQPQVWIRDGDVGTISQLTFERPSQRPSWSPEGDKVAFSQVPGIWVVRADGSAPPTRVDSVVTALAPTSWTRDGRWIMVDYPPPGGAGGVDDIYAVAADGSGSQAVVSGPAQEQSPEVSPDGRWLAYVANASGTQEIYMQPFMRQGGRVLVSLGAAAEPAWISRTELSYISTNTDSLVVARFDFSQGVRVTRTALFSVRPYVLGTSAFRNYDVTRDGQRFLFARRAGGQPDPVVALNWLTEVRRALGTS